MNEKIMTPERALNLLENGLLPQVHGAYYEALKLVIETFKKTKWISVEDRLPENTNDVLVWDGHNNIVAWYMDDKWDSLDICFKPQNPVKYWMPLPKEPEEPKEPKRGE